MECTRIINFEQLEPGMKVLSLYNTIAGEWNVVSSVVRNGDTVEVKYEHGDTSVRYTWEQVTVH